MRLTADFDDALIARYAARGRSPLFALYWTQDQAAYPEARWLDFGAVVLGWWLAAAKSLLEGASEAELSFMDGPFALAVRRSGNAVTVTSADRTWQSRTPLESLVRELLAATDRVQRKFAELGIPDQEGLQFGAQRLRVALLQSKTTVTHSQKSVSETVPS